MTTPRANSYIGVTTDKFRETANFYIQHFGYSINAETGDFICIQSPNHKRTLGFSAPSKEKGLNTAYSGGIYLPFLVDDAHSVLESFKQAGIPITRDIQTQSWGETQFVVTDPSGIELYISEAPKLVEQGS